MDFVSGNPKAFFGIELIHVWTQGTAPYTDKKFRDNSRIDSFFIGEGTRNAINRGAADYTLIALSAVPGLIRREIIPIDMALIQTSNAQEFAELFILCHLCCHRYQMKS